MERGQCKTKAKNGKKGVKIWKKGNIEKEKQNVKVNMYRNRNI